MNEPLDILNAIPELEPDIPAERFLEQSQLPLILACAGAALLMLLVLAAALRKRRRPQAPPTQEELALKALDDLEELTLTKRELSLRLSLILRGFLTGQTQDPALFETHEEFSQRMGALDQVPMECRFDTRCLLSTLAEMKYSGQTGQDAVKTHAYIEQARGLITRITAIQQQEAAREAAAKRTMP